MAAHCTILAWKIPWTEEPGGLQSVGSQRVEHNCAHMHAYTLTLKCVPVLAVGYMITLYLTQ